ncbi:nucleotide exchange factor GrpE [Nocardioides sp.]|uniref:nucleotide exchange factor GrpE n=1 Tax=Nocardioides sp. TaxID=35761 RepID=UPI002632EAD6|nr:nucleotide exchange factor GrpE [Nocardioides sp.]
MTQPDEGSSTGDRGPQHAAPGPGGSFGEEAAEMTENTEVEAGAEGGDPAAASTPAEQQDRPAEGGEHASEALDVDPLQAAHDEVAVLKAELGERTLDLQRLQAEFLNYKRRVDRDRDLVKENATYAALSPITEVLDTIDRAREHEELTGGFKSVVEQLERTVAQAGLVRFGTPGDAFDPSLHEALSHIGEDPDVEVTTCKVIAKAGYRIGDRVVRAAQVLVVDPAGS